MIKKEQQHIIQLGINSETDFELAIQLCCGQQWFDGVKLLLCLVNRHIKDLTYISIANITRTFPQYDADIEIMYNKSDNGYDLDTNIINISTLIKYQLYDMNRIRPNLNGNCSYDELDTFAKNVYNTEYIILHESFSSSIMQEAILNKNWKFLKIYHVIHNDDEYIKYLTPNCSSYENIEDSSYIVAQYVLSGGDYTNFPFSILAHYHFDIMTRSIDETNIEYYILFDNKVAQFSTLNHNLRYEYLYKNMGYKLHGIFSDYKLLESGYFNWTLPYLKKSQEQSWKVNIDISNPTYFWNTIEKYK